MGSFGCVASNGDFPFLLLYLRIQDICLVLLITLIFFKNAPYVVNNRLQCVSDLAAMQQES